MNNVDNLSEAILTFFLRERYSHDKRCLRLSSQNRELLRVSCTEFRCCYTAADRRPIPSPCSLEPVPWRASQRTNIYELHQRESRNHRSIVSSEEIDAFHIWHCNLLIFVRASVSGFLQDGHHAISAGWYVSA